MTQKSETPLRTAASTQESSGSQSLVNEAKHALVDVAGLAADQAETSIKETVSGTKDRAAEGLGSVVQALRGAGEGMGDDADMVRGYVDQVADRVDSLSKYVQQRDVGQIVKDVEKMARREPALFIGGAFVLGLFTARFLKSSGHSDSAAAQEPQRAQASRVVRGPSTQRSQATQARRGGTADGRTRQS